VRNIEPRLGVGMPAQPSRIRLGRHDCAPTHARDSSEIVVTLVPNRCQNGANLVPSVGIIVAFSMVLHDARFSLCALNFVIFGGALCASFQSALQRSLTSEAPVRLALGSARSHGFFGLTGLFLDGSERGKDFRHVPTQRCEKISDRRFPPRWAHDRSPFPSRGLRDRPPH
jgi:hypothetical protein